MNTTTEELKRQIEEAKERIRLNKILVAEQKSHRAVLRAQEVLLRGCHTAHPKGSDHHKSKNWNVWKRVAPNEYEFMRTFGSMGEVARELGKSYMATWGMMRRWQKIASGEEEYKYKRAKFKGLEYRIEAA
jgi:hypothetical protein